MEVTYNAYRPFFRPRLLAVATRRSGACRSAAGGLHRDCRCANPTVGCGSVAISGASHRVLDTLRTASAQPELHRPHRGDSHARRHQAQHGNPDFQRRHACWHRARPYPYNASGRIKFAARNPLLQVGFICVYQHVRGKYGSEGDYIMNRYVRGPLNPTPVSDATDAYDTIG